MLAPPSGQGVTCFILRVNLCNPWQNIHYISSHPLSDFVIRAGFSKWERTPSDIIRANPCNPWQKRICGGTPTTAVSVARFQYASSLPIIIGTPKGEGHALKQSVLIRAICGKKNWWRDADNSRNSCKLWQDFLIYLIPPDNYRDSKGRRTRSEQSVLIRAIRGKKELVAGRRQQQKFV